MWKVFVDQAALAACAEVARKAGFQRDYLTSSRLPDLFQGVFQTESRGTPRKIVDQAFKNFVSFMQSDPRMSQDYVTQVGSLLVLRRAGKRGGYQKLAQRIPLKRFPPAERSTIVLFGAFLNFIMGGYGGGGSVAWALMETAKPTEKGYT